MHPQQPPPGGPVPYDPIIGQTIGNYVVKHKLGEGGMGSVYLAEHPAIGKKVALKVLHAEFAANQEVVSRFFNEARAVNDIQHPNIVDIVDYGVLAAGPSGDQMVYFIMEFLPGISLSELIRRESPIAPERALSICLQIGDALAASHKCGIIHRDLKPDNIILMQRGRERDFVKLLDFGIAKLTGDQAGTSRTRTGIVMGTPAYMSPEQCEGRGNIDHRTDVYALGIVLYEMITGRVPFTGEGYGEVLVQHLTQAPAAPSTIRGLIPPHVEQIVLKALEKRPEGRYPTMEEMMRALADPVGYVEANGGIANFRAVTLQVSQAPLQSGTGVRLTPSPLSPLTPVPGSLAAVPQAPGTPTTLGASAGSVATGSGSGKKVGIFVAIGVAVAAVAAAVVMLVGGGGGSSDETTDPEISANEGTTGDDVGSADKTDPDTVAGNDKVEPAKAPDAGAVVEAVKTPDAGAAVEPAKTPDAGVAVVATKDMVTITIESSPKGAMVFVGSEKDPRGKTPYTFDVEKSDKPIEVKLFMKRYKWEKRTVEVTGNQRVDVTLEKEKKSGGTGGGTKEGGGKGGDDGDSDDTMNPFAKKKKPT